MNLFVEYKNSSGVLSNQTYKLTFLSLIKHLAIAGQGYAPKPQKLIRCIGMLFHYSYYLKRRSFYNNHFSLPPNILYDPTDISQFSNIAGKAIADFLSKKIDKSMFTINYEAAMVAKGMKLKGQRPDLIAFNRSSIFAIEAKGYSSGYRNMAKHKKQSQMGGIPVNFTVACISTNLYNGVKCKYHDPVNENTEFDLALFNQLTRNYYKGLLGFIESKYFEYREVKIRGEHFYEVDLFQSMRNSLFFEDDYHFGHFGYLEILRFLRPKLILPIDIRLYSNSGVGDTLQPFVFEAADQFSNTFIDNDRVGLRIRD